MILNVSMLVCLIENKEKLYVLFNMTYFILNIFIIRVEQIMVVVIKHNKHQQYLMDLHQFRMQFLVILKTVTTLAGYSTSEICKQLKQFSENQVK